jgi:hypothetical protein
MERMPQEFHDPGDIRRAAELESMTFESTISRWENGRPPLAAESEIAIEIGFIQRGD